MGSLSLEELTYQKKHGSNTAVPRLIAIFILSLVIPYESVVGRFISRKLKKTPLKVDDWLTLLSLVSRARSKEYDRI
jgi:hypothetical protein